MANQADFKNGITSIHSGRTMRVYLDLGGLIDVISIAHHLGKALLISSCAG